MDKKSYLWKNSVEFFPIVSSIREYYGIPINKNSFNSNPMKFNLTRNLQLIRITPEVIPGWRRFRDPGATVHVLLHRWKNFLGRCTPGGVSHSFLNFPPDVRIVSPTNYVLYTHSRRYQEWLMLGAREVWRWSVCPEHARARSFAPRTDRPGSDATVQSQLCTEELHLPAAMHHRDRPDGNYGRRNVEIIVLINRESIELYIHPRRRVLIIRNGDCRDWSRNYRRQRAPTPGII